MATRATKAKATPAVDALTCPECGKTFTRAAALGAHRKMTHGVAGSRLPQAQDDNHQYQPRPPHSRRKQRRRAAARP